tara:strand:- start:399 stop:548 length:150 start_codon:yes stop_codon:yes gene_type:complete
MIKIMFIVWHAVLEFRKEKKLLDKENNVKYNNKMKFVIKLSSSMRELSC